MLCGDRKTSCTNDSVEDHEATVSAEIDMHEMDRITTDSGERKTKHYRRTLCPPLLSIQSTSSSLPIFVASSSPLPLAKSRSLSLSCSVNS